MLYYIAFSAVLAGVFGVLSSWSKKSVLILCPMFFIFILSFCYLAVPKLSFEFMGLYVFLFIAFLTISVGQLFYGDDKDIEIKKNIRLLVSTSLTLVFLAILVSFIFTSSNMAKHQEFRKILTVEDVADSTFTHEVKSIDVENMISVDKNFAIKYANTMLGNIPGLGSKVMVNDAFRQTLNGTLIIDGKPVEFKNKKVWISPLEHRNLGKWFWNKGTQGYIIVDATEENKATLVTNLNNEDLRLIYLESAYFSDDIERYLRTRGYLSMGLNDIDFEIDNTGRPFQVITTYKPTIGVKGYVANGIITVDVQTGDIKEYTLETAPDWVERIQPAEFIQTYANDYGQFVEGFWNTLFSENNVVNASPAVTIIDDDNRSYWYVELVSANAEDDSSCGFMLVDTRDKKAFKFNIPGINAQKAKNIIEGMTFGGTKIRATYPIPYNIYGTPTYFMTLRSAESSEFAGYALCSRDDRTCYVLAHTKKEAEALYIKKLQTAMKDKLNQAETETENVTFVIKDKAFEDGKYYFIMKGTDNCEFAANMELSSELKWSQPLDTVIVSYKKFVNGNTAVISKFDNLRVKLQVNGL